jgi:hypothetical protein
MAVDGNTHGTMDISKTPHVAPVSLRRIRNGFPSLKNLQTRRTEFDSVCGEALRDNFSTISYYS